MKSHIPSLILVFVVSQSPISSSQSEQIVTLTGDPWPPYVIGELGEEATSGMGIELVDEIFDRLEDVEARFPLLPWRRALREVEKGTMDGIVMLLKKPEREEYMVYTDHLFTSYNLVWYSRARFPDGFRWGRLEDLAPYRIGVTRGYSYGDDIDRAIAAGSMQVTQAISVEQLFVMLAGKRIDLALSNDAVGYALARKYAHVDEIVPATKATGKEVHYMAFSKKSPAQRLIPAINRVIGDLRDEGVIEKIIRND